MRSGRFRFVAELQNPDNAGSDYSTAGGYKTVDRCVRVDVVPLNGKEVRAEQQQGGETAAEIYCRYRPDITSASRLIVDGTTFEVLAPPLSIRNQKRKMRLQCKVVA